MQKIQTATQQVISPNYNYKNDCFWVLTQNNRIYLGFFNEKESVLVEGLFNGGFIM